MLDALSVGCELGSTLFVIVGVEVGPELLILDGTDDLALDGYMLGVKVSVGNVEGVRDGWNEGIDTGLELIYDEHLLHFFGHAFLTNCPLLRVSIVIELYCLSVGCLIQRYMNVNCECRG